MFNEDNLYFDDDIPQEVKDNIYYDTLDRISQIDISEDKVVFITAMSSLTVYGKIFFKAYILDSYEEKYNLYNKPNFLFFISHA